MADCENMIIWNKVKSPPPEALRQIKGGRLSGFTDINPQFRYKIMTETFGICGVGWKYEIKRLWNEPVPSGEILAFAEIDLYTSQGGRWSEPIPGIGGSMLITKESSGLHVSDEGYKMAITDALSVCMKMLGVAADIYAGAWDGTKYSEPKDTPKPTEPKPTTGEHWCEEHNIAFSKKTKDGNDFYSHKTEEGWCNEKKKNGTKQEPEASQEQEQEPGQEPTESTLMITEELLDNVCEVKGMTTHKQARGYLVGTCKIADSRINNEPQAVWDEVGIMLQGV